MSQESIGELYARQSSAYVATMSSLIAQIQGKVQPSFELTL